ncbi:hypothetical protein O181_037625 [Austropuccinia psidii MF-1]|uniref:Uncharacterized protein n=1 Tax=Austropuccinia psidii MF-1 TaxID=1389203 RepID=A0A9Q3D8I4_9BASI|nr:hypothetical protein [Austropuccinia psidii MF-1]
MKPSVLILDMGTSELEWIGLPPNVTGPPTLVHLAISLCPEPVTISRCRNSIQERNSPDSQLEYPEVPSGLGASKTWNSFPKGQSFLLHENLLMLEANVPVGRHGFFPQSKSVTLKNLDLNVENNPLLWTYTW